MKGRVIRRRQRQPHQPRNLLLARVLSQRQTALIKDKARSLHVIRQIKAPGVGLALDDFGSGYYSLETLRSFPFDKIKLDKAFVEGIEQDQQSKAIVRAVLTLSKSLDIPVLAEGIETDEQMSVLRMEGCDEGQGYLLGRPSPIGDLGQKPEPAWSNMSNENVA